MDELKIALIQAEIFWEDPLKNLASYAEIIARQVEFPVDVIFLPEMFNTGFTSNLKKCAEEMNGVSMQFLKETANEKKCSFMTSLLVHDDGNWFNRQVLISPDGSCHYTDKRHLFRLSDEYKVLTQGKKKIIQNIQGWNILPLICYDLRFPVWSKNRFSNGKFAYDLLVYVANWPASRSHVWKSLLVARAIENLSYVVGVNRVGRDGFGTDHAGESMVIDPKGRILFRAEQGKQETGHVTLSGETLCKIREINPFGQDWDQFTIENGEEAALIE